MPERIFPTQSQDQLGSKLEFNGIDIDTVVAKLAESQDEKKSNLSPELLEKIAQMKLNIVTSEEEDDEEDESSEREAKKAIPEAFKEHMFKKKDEQDKPEEDTEEEEKGGNLVEGKKAEARRRRIRFTSASQLSPEAATAAREQGDEELYKAILAARSDVRIREAQKLIDLSEQALKREAATVNKRNAYRMKVVKNVEQTQKTITNAKAAAANNSVFKTVKSMTDDERNYFQKVAIAKGLPEEYVTSMFAVENTSTDNSAEVSIRDIMASALNTDTKKAAIGGLVKTATLDKENINRLKKYWKEELGYGDEEWIDDLFTTKYDK